MSGPGMGRGSSVESRSASSSRALAGLIGGHGQAKRGKHREEDSETEHTTVSLYETDKTITFLEAGHCESYEGETAV